MGWLVRLRDETTETSCPDVMPEARRQLASKIARVLLPIALQSAEEAEEDRVQ